MATAMTHPLPLRELTGWEEEYLARHQHDANTARTCNEVLARCCVRPGVAPDDQVRAQVRGLLVAERDLELVRLRRMSLGAGVEARVECPVCGAANDASFSLDDLGLDSLTAEFDTPRSGLPMEEGLTLSLPTAGDQEALLDAGLDGPAEHRTWLLARSLRTPDGAALGEDAVRGLPIRHRAALERAIDDRLPTLDLDMAVHCVQCGADFSAPFDVGTFFFRIDRKGRRPARRRPSHRNRLSLVRATDLGPAAEPSPGLSAAARGRRRRRAPGRPGYARRSGMAELSLGREHAGSDIRRLIPARR